MTIESISEELRFVVTNFERPEHVRHLTPGQMFADSGGDLCIYLGWAPEACHHHGTISVGVNGNYSNGTLYEFRPQHVVLCYYKRSWITLENWPKEIETSNHNLSTLLLQEQPKYLK